MSRLQRFIIGLLIVALGVCCVVGLGTMTSNYTAVPTRVPVITAASGSVSVSTSVPTETPTKVPTETLTKVPTSTPQPTMNPGMMCAEARFVITWSNDVTKIGIYFVEDEATLYDVAPGDNLCFPYSGTGESMRVGAVIKEVTNSSTPSSIRCAAMVGDAEVHVMETNFRCVVELSGEEIPAVALVTPTATPYEVTITPQSTWTPTPDARSDYEIEYQECMNHTEGVRLSVEWSTNVTEIKLGHSGEGVYWPDVPPEQYPTYRVSPPNAVCFAFSQADVLNSGDDGVYVIAAVNNEPQGTAWIRCRFYVGTKLEQEQENTGGWYTSVSCGAAPK